jgi:hypothetical protein
MHDAPPMPMPLAAEAEPLAHGLEQRHLTVLMLTDDAARRQVLRSGGATAAALLAAARELVPFPRRL